MQNNNSRILNIVLAAGFISILAGIFLLVGIVSGTGRMAILRPAVVLILGAIVLFIAFAWTRNSVQVFFGMNLVLDGMLILLIRTHTVPATMASHWPLMVVFCGLSLLPAGIYRLKRIRTIYMVPAVTLIVLGAFFMLFSTNIITMPFTHFVARWWPLLLVFAGIVLVVVFFCQQSHLANFPYMKDDSVETADTQPPADKETPDAGSNPDTEFTRGDLR